MSDLEKTESTDKFDYLLVGGGLQSGLIALALSQLRPAASFAIVEREEKLAGNHTWSFHGTDVPAGAREWIEPLMQTSWDRYDVRVGRTQRNVDLKYHSTSSTYFHEAVTRAVLASRSGSRLITSAAASEVRSDHVRLQDGRTVQATTVIDNRGPCDDQRRSYEGGFQKFWGFEVVLPIDWPVGNGSVDGSDDKTENLVPRIMDDRVDQSDGFRFFYTLPFTRRRVLIEDTRFSDTPAIHRGDCYKNADRYLRMMTGDRIGLEDCEIVREENGVLPMPMSGLRPVKILHDPGEVICGGYRGGWFHAATGYSFASAAAFAQLIATTPADELRGALALAARQQQHRGTFTRFLNRLLFRMVRPAKRYQIFQRFYQVLPEQRIARFYRHQFSAVDASRIVIGFPPGGLTPMRFLMSLFYAPFSLTTSSPAVQRVST
ncbi:MAG: lycopene beta-cyclase CrtY [Planctomycetota bacterium]